MANRKFGDWVRIRQDSHRPMAGEKVRIFKVPPKVEGWPQFYQAYYRDKLEEFTERDIEGRNDARTTS